MKKNIFIGFLLMLSVAFSVLSIIGLPIKERYACCIETTMGENAVYKTSTLELNGRLKFNIVKADWELVGSITLDGEKMNMRVSGNEPRYLIGIVDTQRSKIHSRSQVTIMSVFDHYKKGKLFNDQCRIAFPANDINSFKALLEVEGMSK